MKRLTRVCAIIIDNNRIVADRAKGSRTFLIPGGLVNNETKTDALERELYEELAVKLKSSKEFKTYHAIKALYHDSPLDMVTYIARIEGEPQPCSEIEEVVWIGKEDYKNRKYPLAPLFYKVIPDLIEEGYLKF
jgi:8-oxo-dGTP diphosphatase